MTYPPQDPGAPAGDPYGQSQPNAGPPAGGYAPGQAGASPYQAPQPGYEPGYAPAAYPGQADPNAAYYTQPAYDPSQAGQIPYGQYGPPPVQATTKNSGGTVLLVIVVVLLMAAGGVGGYFLLGRDGDEGSIASDDSASAEESDPEGGSDGEETAPEEEAAPTPSGTALSVPSLGSLTPIPGEEWIYTAGPGASDELMADAEIYTIQHTPDWISYLGVGLYASTAAAFDPADLNASAEGAASVWLQGAFDTTEGYAQGEIAYTAVEVDGRPGVLAEWRNSWTSAGQYTDDLYEDTAILVVDVDGVNGFIGVASVSESGTASYAPAVEALLATDFDAETA
ncbi:hypothetical protein [Glycomyces harbinensis]|uniref:Uncharacterized protein n=1 Tax=Glycomyces harbinensis TaxID=58114 RepID=A0A1G6YJ55_9ACTN|nr:hypothetical protein [Glycomyces harbinensis]SDD90408.1 hypothetical protein SAMN05216270_10929 [Glycomyces harbinensis]